MPSDKERIVSYVDPEIKQQASALAERHGQTISGLVAVLLAEYIERQGNEPSTPVQTEQEALRTIIREEFAAIKEQLAAIPAQQPQLEPSNQTPDEDPPLTEEDYERLFGPGAGDEPEDPLTARRARERKDADQIKSDLQKTPAPQVVNRRRGSSRVQSLIRNGAKL